MLSIENNLWHIGKPKQNQPWVTQIKLTVTSTQSMAHVILRFVLGKILLQRERKNLEIMSYISQVDFQNTHSLISVSIECNVRDVLFLKR